MIKHFMPNEIHKINKYIKKLRCKSNHEKLMVMGIPNFKSELVNYSFIHFMSIYMELEESIFKHDSDKYVEDYVIYGIRNFIKYNTIRPSNFITMLNKENTNTLLLILGLSYLIKYNNNPNTNNRILIKRAVEDMIFKFYNKSLYITKDDGNDEYFEDVCLKQYI